jgi:hypothetical protein
LFRPTWVTTKLTTKPQQHAPEWINTGQHKQRMQTMKLACWQAKTNTRQYGTAPPISDF